MDEVSFYTLNKFVGIFQKNAVSQISFPQADSLKDFECSASKSRFMLDILVFIDVYKNKGKRSTRAISKIACVGTEISAKMYLFSIHFGVSRNGIPTF